MMAKLRQFDYKNVKVISVRDGDSVTLEINVGFGFTFKDKFRLHGIDTWELKEDGGEEAKQFVLDWFEEHPVIDVRSFKKGSFGRWICSISCANCGETLNAELLSEGHAEVYKR